MSVDDELRRRMQEAADHAGAGVPENLLKSVNLNGGHMSPSGMSTTSGMGLLGGLGAAGLIVGGALGFTILQPDDDGSSAATIDVQQYTMFDCPDGAAIATAYAGDRVFVIGRDEGSTWFEIRDPRNQSSVVWIPAGAVDPDNVVDVPVHDCEEPIELIAVGAETTTSVIETTTTIGQGTVPATTPVTTKNTTGQGTTPATTPATSPPTTQAPDTTKPVATQATPGTSPIYDADVSGCDTTSGLTVQATDNVGVTQVTGTYSSVISGSLPFVKGAGNAWTATFGPFNGIDDSINHDIEITIVARDAAGNTSDISGATRVTVHVWGVCVS